MQKRSFVAIAAGFAGLLGLFLVAAGLLLIQLGVLAPMAGFGMFFVPAVALVGPIALVIGLVALWFTRAGSGRGGRGLAWIGLGAGLALVAILLVSARPGAGLPRINDITTNVDDPPAFVAALEDPANRGRDMAYDPSFGQLVRGAYADLAPIRVSSEPARAIELARDTAKGLGWEIVDVDAAGGRLEAREVSKLFHFVDDVVVRARPAEGGGAWVDVRSKSRDGKGDLGTNAARIRAFTSALPR